MVWEGSVYTLDEGHQFTIPPPPYPWLVCEASLGWWLGQVHDELYMQLRFYIVYHLHGFNLEAPFSMTVLYFYCIIAVVGVVE